MGNYEKTFRNLIDDLQIMKASGLMSPTLPGTGDFEYYSTITHVARHGRVIDVGES